METNELKSTWQAMEKALERGNQLNLAILRQQRIAATYKSLWPLRVNQTFQIAIGAAFILLASLLWSSKPTAIPVILGGIAIQAYGIGCIITAGVVLAALGRINYDAPVVEVQAGLAQVRRAYGICVVVAGLSWWLLWIPLLVLLAALAHVNLYAHAPSVIWIGVAVGVAGLLGTYWLYRYSLTSSSSSLRQAVEHATFGKSLQNAVRAVE